MNVGSDGRTSQIETTGFRGRFWFPEFEWCLAYGFEQRSTSLASLCLIYSFENNEVGVCNNLLTEHSELLNFLQIFEIQTKLVLLISEYM